MYFWQRLTANKPRIIFISLLTSVVITTLVLAILKVFFAASYCWLTILLPTVIFAVITFILLVFICFADSLN